MITTDLFLQKGEYYQETAEKTVLFLHHTAGSHRPDYVIYGWDSDDQPDKTGKKTPRSVATAYVIGGLSTRTPSDTTWDGQVYRAFDDQYWAHHLGTIQANNRFLNRHSVAIELCNYGPLTKGLNGKFYTYVNSEVPADQIITLDKPFRGFKHYHAYTDKQIIATKELILAVQAKYAKINLTTPLTSVAGFELNANAKNGVSGIYSHSNVRKDKFDLCPQPKMIAMLKEVCATQ